LNFEVLCKRDVRSRDETETLEWRYRDETETFEKTPRDRDVRDRDYNPANHPPSVLWHCWLGHQTCKNRRPYNWYCVGADVKPCSINFLLSCRDNRLCSLFSKH